MESQIMDDIAIRQSRSVSINSQQMMWIGEDETGMSFRRRVVRHVERAVQDHTGITFPNVDIRVYILGHVNEVYGSGQDELRIPDGVEIDKENSQEGQRAVLQNVVPPDGWLDERRNSGDKLVEVLITGHLQWNFSDDLRLGFLDADQKEKVQ